MDGVEEHRYFSPSRFIASLSCDDGHSVDNSATKDYYFSEESVGTSWFIILGERELIVDGFFPLLLFTFSAFSGKIEREQSD